MSKQQNIFILYPAKNEGARKRLGFNNAVYWKTDESLARVILRANVALMDAGFNLEDFKKPVRINFPVENDIPSEGVFDTTFCNNRELGGADGKTLVIIPGKVSAVASDEAESTDSADSQEQEAITEAALPQLTVVATMPLRHRVLAQLVGNGEYLYHVDAVQKAEILRLEMDTENARVQNMILAAENVEPFKKAIEHDIQRVVVAFNAVFPADGKTPELGTIMQFFNAWFGTDHIDRGLLVKEWTERQKNKSTPLQKAESHKEIIADVNTPERPRPRRSEKPTHRTINYELACGFYEDLDLNNLRPAMDFAKRIIAEDREDWKRMSATVGIIPNIKEFDRQTIIDLVRKAPKAVHTGAAELRRTWCESFLAIHGVRDPDWYEFKPNAITTTHEEKAARICLAGKQLRDIEAGRFQCDEEKPQSSVVLADEPATPETMEPDTTEHHQDTQPLDAEPQINTVDAGYQKIRAELHEARANIPPKNPVDVGKQLAAARGEYVEGLSDPNDPKWLHENYSASASNEGKKTEVQTGHDEETPKETADGSVQEDNEGAQSDAGCDSTGAASDTVNQVWPSWFEPGRYEDIPNEVYHSANGISSTMLKDARISLMYYHGRHIAGTIPREESDALLRGRIIHNYTLETEKFADEYAVPVAVPDYVVTTSQDLIAIIKEYNANLPALMAPEEMKQWIENYNSNLTQPVSLGASAEETGLLYNDLPEAFRRIPEGEKHTASAMKACIKEYNATLPPLLKTTGTREQLLDQIGSVAPEMAEKERAKFLPYNVSGTKEQLTEIARTIQPDLVTLDDWQKQQAEASQGKTLISREMYEQAININAALQNNPDAARLLNHPERKSEISYFGFDEETGLEIRVRPDIEIRLPYESICADLKSVSLGYVRQERLKDRLHREIIERDYHLSAAMYCDVANLDKFFWIFVNKDAGYHWVAVVEASPELLELGRQEYRRTLRQINEALETNHWPAPITESYTDELNDFDLRRLEALSI